jgi:hypothetical protein
MQLVIQNQCKGPGNDCCCLGNKIRSLFLCVSSCTICMQNFVWFEPIITELCFSLLFNKHTYPANDVTRCAESAIYILHIFAYNFGTTIVCKNVLENIFPLIPCRLSPPPISNVDYLERTTLCNTKITIFNIDMREGWKNSSHITEKLRKNAFSKNFCTGLSRFEKWNKLPITLV